MREAALRREEEDSAGVFLSWVDRLRRVKQVGRRMPVCAVREAAIRWAPEDSAGIFLFWVDRLRSAARRLGGSARRRTDRRWRAPGVAVAARENET